MKKYSSTQTSAAMTPPLQPPGVTSLQLKPPAPGSASSMRRLGPGEVEYLDLDHGGTATPPAQEVRLVLLRKQLLTQGLTFKQKPAYAEALS